MERKPCQLSFRVPPNLGDKLDEWRREQPDIPSRNEAARRLLELALAVVRGQPLKLPEPGRSR